MHCERSWEDKKEQITKKKREERDINLKKKGKNKKRKEEENDISGTRGEEVKWREGVKEERDVFIFYRREREKKKKVMN
jgi:1,4-alpha-glucan branching enzyme